MALLIDRSGNAKEVSSSDVHSYLSKGYIFSPDSRISVESIDGEMGTMDAAEATEFLSDPNSGYSYLAPETLNEIRIRDEQDNLEGQAKATAEGAARALTFGASDLALEKLGVDPQGIQDRKILGGSMAGEAAALVAPWEKLGRVGKALGSGVTGLDKVARKASEALTKKIVKSKIGKGVAKGAVYGGIEGGAYEAAQGFSEEMLGDSSFNGEAVIARAKNGMTYGAGLGGLFGGLGAAVSKVEKSKKLADNRIKKYRDNIIPLDVSMKSIRKDALQMKMFPNVKAVYDEAANGYIVKAGKDAVLELDNSLDGFKILDMDNLDTLDETMDDLGFFDYRDYLTKGRNPEHTILMTANKSRANVMHSLDREYGRAIDKSLRLKKGWNRLRGKKNKTKADIQKVGKHRAAYEQAKMEMKAAQDSKRSLRGLHVNEIPKSINKNFDAIKDGDSLYILKPERFDSINRTAYKKLEKVDKLDKPTSAALSALGATKASFKELDKNFGATRKLRIANYAKDMLNESKFLDGLDEYEDYVRRDIKKSVFDMDNAIDEIDNYFELNNIPSGINLDRVLNDVKYDISKGAFYSNGKIKPDTKNVYKKLMAEINALKNINPKTISELRELRMDIDDGINWKSTKEETSVAVGKRKIRKAMEDEIIKTSERFEELSELVEKYKAAKIRYADGLAVDSIIKYGQTGAMGNNKIGLTSMILAGDIASTGTTVPTMLAGGAGAIALREATRRYGDKVVALYGDKVFGATKGVRGAITKSAKSFLESPSSRIILPATVIFTPRELELRNLNDYQNYVYDIRPIMENFQKQNEHYAEYLPETAAATQQALARGMSFLNSKMPKNPYGNDFFKRHTPPEMEMRKFERYKNAVSNPLNILKEIEHGYASPEGVEVLREVYPAVYESLKAEFLDQLTTKKPDYRKRLQINKMFNIETDYYLQPQNIMALQKSAKLINSQEETSGNMQNAGKINKDDRSLTDAQRVTAF